MSNCTVRLTKIFHTLLRLQVWYDRNPLCLKQDSEYRKIKTEMYGMLIHAVSQLFLFQPVYQYVHIPAMCFFAISHMCDFLLIYIYSCAQYLLACYIIYVQYLYVRVKCNMRLSPILLTYITSKTCYYIFYKSIFKKTLFFFQLCQASLQGYLAKKWQVGIFI